MPANYDIDCDVTFNDIDFLNSQKVFNNDPCNIGSNSKKSTSSSSLTDNSQIAASQSKRSILKLDTSLSSWGLPENVLMKYREKGIKDMFDWQVECLGSKEVLHFGNNLVYSAPTSAGKTLVAEILALKTLLEKQKKVIIILPFVSVVREKMFYFQDILSLSGIRVEGFMGSHNPPGGFKAVQLAICTIEKANSIINKLLEEGSLKDIGAVIIDEMHLLGDPSRGYLLELLLTKLRYMCNKNKEIKIQLIGMSATLPNLDLLSKWLTAELYTTTFRPIPLQEYCLISEEILNTEFMLDRRLIRHPDLTEDTDNILQLCLETISKSCSVLIFCPTKNWCENLAQQISVAFFKLGRSKTKFGLCLREQLDTNLIAEILEQLKRCPVGLDTVLRKTVSFGVAFHHAGLTMDERDIIEGAFRNGGLRVLIATSTLSSGVNLPAQRVIIRTPMFHGKPLNSLTYRQMIGRAGRMGKDTSGESILVCQKNDKRIAEELLAARLQPIESCLEGAGKLKRAILEVIASGVAVTPEDVTLFTNCTLLAASVDGDLGSNNPVEKAIEFLKKNEFIRLQNDEKGDLRYVATNLAKACLSSSLPPEDGLALFEEIDKARQSFVLDTDLHLLYLVTPYSVCSQWSNLDWMVYLDFWEKLPLNMKRVADLVGVQESFIFNATRGRLSSNTSKQFHRLQIHRRFYTALALQDLVNEIPLNEVAAKFQCNRGMLQSLQQSASMFAGMVASFCHQLGWKCVELLVSQFQDRLQFGIQHELLDLMKLPNLNGQRARSLYNAGIESLTDLAAFDVCKLENILLSSVPFESEKEKEGETAYDMQQKKKIRSIFITGKQGLTAREAAIMLIKDARKYLQLEIGAAVLKWDTTENVESLKISDSNSSKGSLSSLSDPEEIVENQIDIIQSLNKSVKPKLVRDVENSNKSTAKEIFLPSDGTGSEITPKKIENKQNSEQNIDKNIESTYSNKNEVSIKIINMNNTICNQINLFKTPGTKINNRHSINLNNSPKINTLSINKNFVTSNNKNLNVEMDSTNNKTEINQDKHLNISFKDCLTNKIEITTYNQKNSDIISDVEKPEICCTYNEDIQIEDSDSPNASLSFMEISNQESNYMDLNFSDLESGSEQENKDNDNDENIIDPNLSDKVQSNDNGNDENLVDSNICDDVFGTDWTQIPSFSVNNSKKSQEVQRFSSEFNKSDISAKSETLFDDSMNLDSKLLNALDSSISVENMNDNTEVKMEDTSLFDNILDSFSTEEHQEELSNENKDTSDLIETSQSEINDYTSNSVTDSNKKLISTPKKRNRNSENIRELLDTPSKKLKTEKSYNEIDNTINLTSIEIIDVCKDIDLFNTFRKEIKLKHKISFAIACEYKKQDTPLIGQNIVNSPRNIKTVRDNKNEICVEDKVVTGIAISDGNNTSYFISFQNEDIISNTNKIKFIQDLVQNHDLKMTIFDCKEQAKILYRAFKILIISSVEDPKVGDWILEPEEKEKNLSAMALKYSPEAVGISQLAGSCKGVGSIALEINSAILSRIRASVEALVTFQVMESQRNLLAEQDSKLLNTFEIEMKSLLCLVKMELIGFGIDKNKMNVFISSVQEQMALLQRQAFALAGRYFNFTSSKDVAKVLGIYRGRKVSTNKQTLEQSTNPISKLILQWRKLNCTLTKMMYPILRSIEDDRIHGCCVTHSSTGRISMHEPNLQNIPRNFEITKFDKTIVHLSPRASFVPGRGKIFLSADYCQLELRLLAHLSEDPVLCNIMKSKVDVFKSIAAKLNKISEVEVTDELRQRAKQLCYGIIYGMGAKVLSDQLNSTEEEAREFTLNFKNTYPRIQQFIQLTINQCKELGFVETLAGRRRYLPNINSENFTDKSQAERQAVNTTVQGSAADIAKSAMVVIDQQLVKFYPTDIPGQSKVFLVLHLHDELLYEVPISDLKNVARIVKDSMENCVNLTIPFPVKLRTGYSWGELEEFTF